METDFFRLNNFYNPIFTVFQLLKDYFINLCTKTFYRLSLRKISQNIRVRENPCSGIFNAVYARIIKQITANKL